MKDKRKEILKDLLGEFATGEETQEDKGEIIRSKREKKEILPNKNDEDEFKLDKIVKKPPKKHTKKIKKVSDGFKAEIVEEGLIPRYNVSLPKFSEKERILFNEIREKLVEVAVSQGEDFKNRGRVFHWRSKRIP